MRRYFSGDNELANGALRALSVEMPTIDLEHLRAVAMPQRRPVTPASPPGRRTEGRVSRQRREAGVTSRPAAWA